MTIKEKLKQFIRVNNIKQKEIAEILGYRPCVLLKYGFCIYFYIKNSVFIAFLYVFYVVNIAVTQ